MNDQSLSSTWKTLRKLWPHFRFHRGWLAGLAFCGVSMAILNIISPYLLKSLTDSLVDGQTDRFVELIILGVGIMIFGTGVTYLKGQSAARYEVYTIRDFRDRISSHIQHLPLSFVESLHSGDLVSRLNNDIEKIAGLLKRAFDYFYQPLVFVLSFSYMLILSWKLLLATCILIPISAVLYDKVIKPIQAHSQKQMEHLAEANAVTQDAIQGITIIKAFNLQGILTRKYQHIAQQVEHEGLEIEKRAAIEFAVFLALRFVPQLILPLYGGYLAFIGEISVGDLLACLSLIWLVILPVEALLEWIRQAREIAPAIERIFQILDHPTELTQGWAFAMKPESAPIRFEQVSFQYTMPTLEVHNGDTRVLDQLSFEVQEGQTVALVGPSGCGKSTVLKLLCGFYAPQEGTIRLYGNDLFQTNMAEMRSLVALVSQDTYLFPATIAENIAYGRPGATQAEIITAAKAANAHDFICEQPDGYETHIGEWGQKLSGGERQRIALARAILKDAPILLLDEPTSALDTQSEALVQDALERLMRGKTVVIVAHRLSTIKAAAQILALDQGRIQEVGTHAQLMQKGGLYQRLYLQQIVNHEAQTETQRQVAYA